MADSRRDELLERAYAYVSTHGLTALSLRPLAAAIGSSPRVLLFLFGSKDGLVQALLARARTDELRLLHHAGAAATPTAAPLPITAPLPAPAASPETPGPVPAGHGPSGGIEAVALRIWGWLSDPAHRGLLILWVEAYGRSLIDPAGPWAGFARDTVTDWLAVLAAAQPAPERDTPEGEARRTAVLALLRGTLLDLLATGDLPRTTAALHTSLHVIPHHAAA
ncbi:TetR family transcriptional regulator [Actinoplanes sp. NPDC051851]|uniref:TetR/AcrR family transcriptional regulator n=1 Tax=Actinoplanes sp. NPDC051851 TaxID=3154753 RepID=UPI00341CE177